MKATKSAAAAAAMFLALFLSASPLLNSDAAPSPGTARCRGRLLLLLPCMAFVEGTAGDPTDACCDNLVNLYRDEPDCLCPLLAVALAMPQVNRTLALRLPMICRLNLTDGSCSAAVSPVTSPPALAPPLPASELPALPPPPPPARLNNQVLGMNQGERLSTGEASAGFAAAVILIVLMADIGGHLEKRISA